MHTMEMVRDHTLYISVGIYCFSSILLDGSINNTEEDDEDVGRR